MFKTWKVIGNGTWLLIAVLLMASLLGACTAPNNNAPPPTPVEEPGVEPVDPQEPEPEPVDPEEPEATPVDPEEPEPVEPTDDEDLQGSIRIAVVQGAMFDTMGPLARQFEDRHPGVTVEVEMEPEGGAFEALIAAGNQPDIIVVSFGPQIGRLAAQGAAVPLEDRPDAQELFDRLEPGTVEQLYGHNYYVPIGTDVTMMIYNKSLFEEAGLDPDNPPETWDEFLEAAEAISALGACEYGDRTYGTVFWNEALQWGGWYWNTLQPMYLNANQGQCQLLNRLGTDIVFDQPECAMADFFEFNRAAQEFAPPTMEEAFFGRCIGMWLQYGYSWEPNLESAAGEPMVIGEDVGIAPVPVPNAGDTAYTTYGGRGLMIMQTSPEREELAWQFILFLMEDEPNMTFLTELGYLPTLTALQDDEYFQDPERAPFVEILENGMLPEQIAAAETTADAVQTVYQEVAVDGTMDPETGVEEAAQRARAELQE
jgi:multiple sugar transport system substrate-binding protein